MYTPMERIIINGGFKNQFCNAERFRNKLARKLKLEIVPLLHMLYLIERIIIAKPIFWNYSRCY